MSTKKALIAVRVGNRDNSAQKIQQILTNHGCNISVRLGLHDNDDGGVCSPCGTMILQLSCSSDGARALVKELCEIESVKAQFIDLD
jgi:hypothetical protein